MGPTNPLPQAPTAAELLSQPVVQSALAQAWIDFQADDPVQRHEEGGWIYMDSNAGTLAVRRASGDSQDELEVGNPPLLVIPWLSAFFIRIPIRLPKVGSLGPVLKMWKCTPGSACRG